MGYRGGSGVATDSTVGSGAARRRGRRHGRGWLGAVGGASGVKEEVVTMRAPSASLMKVPRSRVSQTLLNLS
jgi:hypothetical protein